MILCELKVSESKVVKLSKRKDHTIESLTDKEYEKLLKIKIGSFFRKEEELLAYMVKMTKKYNEPLIAVLDGFYILRLYQDDRATLYKNIKKFGLKGLRFLRKATLLQKEKLYRGLTKPLPSNTYTDKQFSSWTYSVGAASEFGSNIYSIGYESYKDKVAWSYLNQDLRISDTSSGYFSEREVVLVPGDVVVNPLRTSVGQVSTFTLFGLVRNVSLNRVKDSELDKTTKYFIREIKSNKKYLNYRKLKGLMIKLDLWTRDDDKREAGWVYLVKNLQNE